MLRSGNLADEYWINSNPVGAIHLCPYVKVIQNDILFNEPGQE